MRLSELLDWTAATLPPIDEEVSATDPTILPKEVDLVSEYTRLNKLLFGGTLGIYPMKWNHRKGAGALVRFRRMGSGRIAQAHIAALWSATGTTGQDQQFKIVSIEVSTFYVSDGARFLGRLAHEMIHVALLEQGIDDGHGRRFRAEMDRINNLGLGFRVNVREDASTLTPTAVQAGKKVASGILLLDGRSFYAYLPKNFPATFHQMITGFPSSWWGKRTIDWYVIQDPWVLTYPRGRELARRFSTYRADEQQLKSITGGEHIATIRNGEPKILLPKYFAGLPTAFTTISGERYKLL